MKRTLIAATVVVALLASGAQPAAARDKNCSDFKTQKQAQKFFKKHGGSKHNDPYGLDSDHDGKACELLPKASSGIGLDGRYDVIGRVTSSNDGTTGTVARRVYEFTSRCSGRACQRVDLRRSGAAGDHFRSTLRLQGNGSYEGTEHSGRINCPGTDQTGTQLVHFTIRPRLPLDGVATKFTGIAHFVAHCDGGAVRELARLVGTY